ncbi:MAG: pantetheine-phosphate adenylyltransferase [Muribaculaceae bacterium]|nr:pantetheine-phosphate adenylyltransferase [Muribaculaceae bacterium]
MKAFFPGSFNPFTAGHKSIVDRALKLFDGVVIGIGKNNDKPNDDVEQRLAAIRAVYEDESRVEVLAYSGVTFEAAKNCDAKVILRGVRSVKDFEYERDMADANRALGGIETLCLFAEPEMAWISSSLVRDLEQYDVNTDKLLP